MRHLAFIGDASKKAAEATECVFEQSPEKYWTFRDLIFQNQNQLKASGNNSASYLKTLVGKVEGINQAQFNTCLDSGKYTSLIQQEYATGQQLKIPGTPSIFVGDKLVLGAGGGVPTVEDIGKVIDQALAQKQGP